MDYDQHNKTKGLKNARCDVITHETNIYNRHQATKNNY